MGMSKLEWVWIIYKNQRDRLAGDLRLFVPVWVVNMGQTCATIAINEIHSMVTCLIQLVK